MVTFCLPNGSVFSGVGTSSVPVLLGGCKGQPHFDHSSFLFEGGPNPPSFRLVQPKEGGQTHGRAPTDGTDGTDGRRPTGPQVGGDQRDLRVRGERGWPVRPQLASAAAGRCFVSVFGGPRRLVGGLVGWLVGWLAVGWSLLKSAGPMKRETFFPHNVGCLGRYDKHPVLNCPKFCGDSQYFPHTYSLPGQGWVVQVGPRKRSRRLALTRGHGIVSNSWSTP